MANYDPLSVLIDFLPPAGKVSFTGLFEGTFVEATRDKDSWAKKTGATGDVARAKIRDKGGLIKVTLLMTSATNQQLSKIHKLDEQLPVTNAGAGPFQIKDLLGGTLCHASFAWIKKVSDIKFGAEILAREWTFDCASLDIDVNGE